MAIKPRIISTITLLSALLLSACEAQQFGMDQSQFQQLNVEQQNQVIAAYNQRQQTAADNAVYTDAIDNAASIISTKQLQN